MSNLGPNFENFKKAIKRQMPVRVPLAELAVDTPVKEAFLGRPLKTIADEVDFWYQAGYDYAWIRAAYGIDELFPGAYESGMGHAAAPIKSFEDFDKYPWRDASKLDFVILDDAAKVLPGGMKIISGEGGFFSFSWMLMGMENFCIQCFENPSFAENLITKVCQTLIEINKRVAIHPAVGALWIGDDLAFNTSLFMPDAWLKKYIFPYYATLGQICRENNKLLIFHSDGNIKILIEDLIAVGVDALHPIEPQAMDIVEIKKEFGDRIALIGNIDLIYTLPYGSVDEVKAEVRKRITDVGKNGGYCVGSANSLTKNIPLKNYKAMIEAAIEYGKYPVS